jgi:D-sedoheptulose 7-phosphate isomerase
MNHIARKALEDGAILHHVMADTMTDEIEAIAKTIAAAFQNGNKLLLFGNGGSAADAQHIAAEFVNRFLRHREAYPAIALTTDTSVLTSIANDDSFEAIFSRQIQAIGKYRDIAIGISTSGSSKNVIDGLFEAASKGMWTVLLTSDLAPKHTILDNAHVTLRIPSRSTPRIQEAHIAVGHILCDLVEMILE